MSRRRQRGAAYRTRRAQRQARIVCVSDIVTVTIGPLTACTWPLSMEGLLVADVDGWVKPANLSTPEEVAAFFADNVTHDTSSSRGNVR